MMRAEPGRARRVARCWAPAGSPSPTKWASVTMTSRRAVPGRERPSSPSRASIARQAFSVLSEALKSVTFAGDSPGRVRAWAGVANRTGPVLGGAGEAAGGGGLAEAGVAVARDRAGRGLLAEDLAGCLAGAASHGLLVLALLGCAGREGGQQGEVVPDGGLDLLDGVADRVEEV